MAGRQIQGQGGRRHRLLTPHDLAGIISNQESGISGPIDYNTLINKPTTSSIPEGSNLYFTAARVLSTVLTGLSTATSAVITAADSVLVALGKLQAQITANVTAISGKLAKSANLSDVADAATARGNLGVVIPQGYIDGLQMVWNSATSISVTSGAAYIPSLGNVLASNSALTLSGLSLAASTWYHVYLYSNAGTPAIECVTTAPSGPYNGAARTKTGDASRRYLGSLLTDASGNIVQFTSLLVGTELEIKWVAQGNVAPWRILSGGAASSPTAVSIAAFVPVSGLMSRYICGVILFISPSSSAAFGIGSQAPASAAPELGMEAYGRLSASLPSNNYAFFPPASVRITGQTVLYVVDQLGYSGSNVSIDTRGVAMPR